MYGMALARYAKFPEVKTKGMTNFGQLVAFTSSEVPRDSINSAEKSLKTVI